MIKDILIKAAEDVSQGMWCAGAWFEEAIMSDQGFFTCAEKGNREDAIQEALRSHRCAEGSVALATVLLGGKESDYEEALKVAKRHMDGFAHDPIFAPWRGFQDASHSVQAHNDWCIANRTTDPFEAGQELAELFRKAADSL